jgi:hypothetical protein
MMAIFVDSVGLNTLVSSSFDNTNTITSNVNNAIASIPPEEKLVAINIHRNGPYGYSSWNQLRVSDNPISRNHRGINKMTFIVQPGPIRNVLSNGDLRVRDRYSVLYSYTEPAITQKAYPLVWNVGRHFKDEEGNIDFENPQRFSIISSYGNQQIAFANDKVSKLHKFDPDEEQTEYVAIKDMYLENGLNKQDSPLTHWEFLQYRETIFPKAPQQFVRQTRTRPQFESFYRHNRDDRTKSLQSSSFGWTPFESETTNQLSLPQSTWPLDESSDFLTSAVKADGHTGPRKGEGALLNTWFPYWSETSNYKSIVELNDSDPIAVEGASNEFDKVMGPGPQYLRRTGLLTGDSVSNPSGMLIQGTSSGVRLRTGGALWEAGSKRQIKNADGTYTHAPKEPFYDTYEGYVEDVRKQGKNYSIIPEFRMSVQVEDYKTTGGEIEIDMFQVTGGVIGLEDSSKSGSFPNDPDTFISAGNFFEVYSNTDFMKNFEVIADDHTDFTNGKVLSLRCKAIKKFLPYEGFYPCQRTVDITKRFYDSFKDNIKLYNSVNVQINDFNYGKQMVMTPLFAPGVLFNTIKSGIAVDYPIITEGLVTTTGYISSSFDRRIPFEALINPKKYLADYKISMNEPRTDSDLSASAIWDGEGDEFYSMMTNNFLAESINFFLPNGQLSSVVSKKQKDIKILEAGRVYGMRVKMRRSMDKARPSVYHKDTPDLPYFPPQDIILTGSYTVRESFTMYSRPSAFGPPSQGQTAYQHSGGVPFIFDQDRVSPITTIGVEVSSGGGFNYPFTPPYYHGEAWCDMWITGSGEELTIKQIQSRVTASFTRFDGSFFTTGSSPPSFTFGPQSFFNDKINKNAVQISSSMNIFGIGTTKTSRGTNGSAGSLVVDSGVEEENRWVMQTKFETPMLNFNHITSSTNPSIFSHLSIPTIGSASVPRGMWHQYGRLPEEGEGVFVQVGPIPNNWQTSVMKKEEELSDLSEHLGFSGVSTKLGRIANRKEIFEAVVAVPFIKVEGQRRFFKLDKDKIDVYKAGPNADGALAAARFNALTEGPPESQIGRSVLDQMEKMAKYIFPPSFDFMNFDTEKVTPIAMYIFEFSHTLTQTDLQDIWQNLPPDIGTEMEVAEAAITHPLLKKELLGQGGEGGNDTVEMSNKLQWMVFKVKQRAANNYFKKTVLRNPEVNTDIASGNVTQDEFGETSTIQYNWPYDFFSLVEMVRIDSEVEMGNADFSEYTDNLPSWDAVQADQDKIEYIVGGLEDEPIPEVSVPDLPDFGNTGTGNITAPTTEDTGPEGIFDSNPNISDANRQNYVTTKGRFTVEANKDPINSFSNLWSRTRAELQNLGINLSALPASYARSWAENWFNTDPDLELKKQQARAGADSAATLNQQVVDRKDILRRMKATFINFYNNGAGLGLLAGKADRAATARSNTGTVFSAENDRIIELFDVEGSFGLVDNYKISWLTELGHYD